MAFTVTTLRKSVYGNNRVAHLQVTADSAEATIDTGLGKIDGFAMGPGSITCNTAKCFINVGSTATALNGFMGLSGVTSGDVFFLTVFGV